MAERRMFSKSIVNSARFLMLSSTARLLYYDLGMAADDDGIVEAFTVIRTTNASAGDLYLLVDRGFVTILDPENLVAFITDWETNNQIRKDRYKPSVYRHLLVKIEDGNQVATKGIPSGNQMETQVRLGKDRLGKDSSGKERIVNPPHTEEKGVWGENPKTDFRGEGVRREQLPTAPDVSDEVLMALREQKRKEHEQWVQACTDAMKGRG